MADPFAKNATVRIICPDGMVWSSTTRVEVDGKPLTGVRRVEVDVDAAAGVVQAVLHLDVVGLDLAGRVTRPGRIRKHLPWPLFRFVAGLRYAVGLK